MAPARRNGARIRKHFIRRHYVALALISAIAGVASTARAVVLAPQNEFTEHDVERAVFSDGKLWMLTDTGQLFTIAEGQDIASSACPCRSRRSICESAIPSPS
jgi:hypothetical protein